jgi:hypothetical protein
VKILVGFEGSCPQSQKGVKQEGPRRYRICPSWRPSPGISEEAVGRSTRLGFRIQNDSGRAQAVDLLIDWQYDDAPAKDRPSFKSREEFMSYRDFVVVKDPRRKEWYTVTADVDASVATVRLPIPAGVTEVQWHPPYTYTQGEDFVASLREDRRVKTERIGESEEKRHLWMLRITDDSTAPKKRVIIRARAHGYESGGSYAMEGMLRWLIADSDWALQALRKYEFFVIPMANPDGVFNGLGRLTKPQGADVVWASVPNPDKAHSAVREVVDRIKPVIFVDLHNWQHKYRDGLLDMDARYREQFLLHMPDQRQFEKRWQVRDPEPVPTSEPARETMGQYCHRVYGSVHVSFEFPWFRRTLDDVRWTGQQALWAFLRAIDEVGWDAR